MRKIFDVTILLLILLVISCDSLKFNYDVCGKNSECKSGKCALMGIDYVLGREKRTYACASVDLKNLNQSCIQNSQCISGLCEYTMNSSKRAATNFQLNGNSCGCNSECYSNNCLNSVCSGAPKFNYDLCIKNRECFSGICALMYTDYGDDNSTNSFACVPKGLMKIGDTCNKNVNCVTRSCQNMMVAMMCSVSNYRFNGEKCNINDDCFSEQCVKGSCSGLKLNYDICKSSAECLSGKCGFMGTDYGNGLPKDQVKLYSCVPKGKVHVGKSCIRNSQCASNLCVYTAMKQTCAASNYKFNYQTCTSNLDCLSGHCFMKGGKKYCKGVFN